MAIGGMSMLAENGVSVPADMSVAGYGEINVCAYTSPRLTTVRRDVEFWGQTAARLLLQAVDGAAVPEHTHVEGELLFDRRSALCRLEAWR